MEDGGWKIYKYSKGQVDTVTIYVESDPWGGPALGG